MGAAPTELKRGLKQRHLTMIAMGGVNATAGTSVPQVLLLISLLAFAGSWIKLGASALGREPIRAITPA